MKKFLAVILALALCLFTAAALAEDTSQTVTALGTATVTVTPDSASFSAGVTTQDTEIKTAQAVNSEAMQAVVAALEAAGVADEDLQTENYSISPTYDYSGDTQATTGYSISNTVQVTVRDLNQLSALLDAATTAGANETYGVTFTSSQYDTAYDQALQAAVLDAVRKAGVMAQATGLEAGSVISLAETGNTYLYAAGSSAMEMDDDSATPIQNGTLSVTANVTAVVELK